jgi:hypothetical protein
MNANEEVAFDAFYDFAKKTDIEKLKEIQKHLNELIISSEATKIASK